VKVLEIINPDTKKILSCLDNKARFVGGCVRNKLLGINITDIDIACLYPPDITTDKLSKKNIRVIPTGIKHGTVTAVLNNKTYEITTLRKDVACDGRHAEVEYTDSWEEDAARRDFTVNAMFMDIEGNIYDYFGGREDLQNGVVKFVGNAEQRVSEDILRILRFFRFYAYYGKGKMDANSLEACEKFADKIPELSGERIQSEMFKLLAAKEAIEVLRIMVDKKITDNIFISDIDLEAFEELSGLSDNVLLRLAGLINRYNQKSVTSLSEKWKLSNKNKNYLSTVLFPSVKIDFNSDVGLQKRAIRKLGGDIYKDIILLAWSCKTILKKDMEKLIKIEQEWQVPEFPLNGNDIKKLGIRDGKQIGKMLFIAEEFWEENNYNPSKKEILDYILKRE